MLKMPTYVWILTVIPLVVAAWCIYNGFNTNSINAQAWIGLATFLAILSIIIVLVSRVAVEPRCDYCGGRLSDMMLQPKLPTVNEQPKDQPQSEPVQRCKITAVWPENRMILDKRVITYTVLIDEQWYYQNNDGLIHTTMTSGRHRVGFSLTLIGSDNKSTNMKSEIVELDIRADCMISVRYLHMERKLVPFITE